MKQASIATQAIADRGFACVTVVEVTGSAPCSQGDRMLCSDTDLLRGTIGGGNLEYQALALARTALNEQGIQAAENKCNSRFLQSYTLSASLGQCCGGRVKLLIETIVDKPVSAWKKWYAGLYGSSGIVISLLDQHGDSASEKIRYQGQSLDLPGLNPELVTAIQSFAHSMLERSGLTGSTESAVRIAEFRQGDQSVRCCFESGCSTQQAVAVFGAGHIARALVPMIIDLPVTLYWIDERKDQFRICKGFNNAVNYVHMPCDEAIAELPEDSICLVMTHSHQLDFLLCRELLPSDKCAWLGLVGSEIKNRRFRHGLEQRGLSASHLDKLRCPVGVKHKHLKSPQTIAISLAMEVTNDLELRMQRRAQER